MDYETARTKLVEYIGTFKPEDEMGEVLAKAVQALDDCLVMGLNGEWE